MSHHRQRLRALGLKPTTFWLPNPSTPAFLAQASAEARAVATASEEPEIMGFISDLQDWPADEEVFWREPGESAER